MGKDERKVLMSIQNMDIEFTKKKNMLSRATPIRVIRDLSLDIHEGEIIAVVGESGCGKTTLGKAICGLYKPAKGKVMFNGKDIWNSSKAEFDEYRHSVQMVQQDSYAALNPVRNIYETLSGPLLEKKLVKNGVEARARVAELLRTVELNPPELFFEKYPHQLSGGQRQRILMARAISLNPKLIVADEPVSMIDVSLRISILNLMSRLNRELGIAFVYITHDLATARYIAQSGKICVMYLGKLVEYGDILPVIRKPMHPYLQVLISAVPVPDPTVEKNKKRLPLKSIDMPSVVKPPSGCPFHPRCIFADGLCEREDPQLKQAEDGRLVACHHYLELEERAREYKGESV